jgi:hypothetical protein
MRIAILLALAFFAVSFSTDILIQPASANGCGIDPNGAP